ncbi:hypothetical protein OAH29_04590, partial [Akkermansiaceae bacterium]|nr:hypothetical protein [Akkermansiaceae bacterium]
CFNHRSPTTKITFLVFSFSNNSELISTPQKEARMKDKAVFNFGPYTPLPFPDSGIVLGGRGGA